MTTHPARVSVRRTAPDPGEGSVAAWVLGSLAVLVLGVIGLLLWLVVPTWTAPGPGEPGYGTVDPHGYVMILGTVLLVFSTLVLVCLAVPLGLVLARLRRSRR
jgi:hypothetical protein